MPGEDSSDNPWVLACCCCCMCCILLIPVVFMIITAVNSKGLTSCPPAPPAGTSVTLLPNTHVLVNDQYQGSSSSSSGGQNRGFMGHVYKEIPLYDAVALDNVTPGSIPTPLGKWRETRSWYLKQMWAYVVEGTTTPLAIAWQPVWSWTATYHVQRCYPHEEYILSMDILWFQFSFSEQRAQWTIANEQGTQIAKSQSIRSRWYVDGWDTNVLSTQLPGVLIASMHQTVNNVWQGAVPGSKTMVNVSRPDLLKPYVPSFMSAGVDMSRRRRSDSGGGRRRR